MISVVYVWVGLMVMMVIVLFCGSFYLTMYFIDRIQELLEERKARKAGKYRDKRDKN